MTISTFPATPPAPEGPAPTAGPAHRRRQQPRWRWRIGVVVFVALCLAVGLGAPLPYFVVSLDTLAQANQGLAGHYVDQPAWIQQVLRVHAGFSGLALVLTPVQWSGRIRRRRPAVHRGAGRVSAAAIMAGAASGLVIAQVGYAGWSGRIGFSMLSLVWLYATVRTVTEARRGDRAAHRRWGLRVVALTFAAVTLRLWVAVWVGISMPTTAAEAQTAFDQMYTVTPFLAWIPNLAVVEWWLRRSTTDQVVPG
ncbi:MAG: DUF2306 domain-containing protein [Acidimicrobiales bacterium]